VNALFTVYSTCVLLKNVGFLRKVIIHIWQEK